MDQNLAQFSVDRQIEQDVFIDAVVVMIVVRIDLIGPDRFTRLRAPRKDRAGPLIIPRPLVGIPRTRIGCTVVDQIEVRIEGNPTPSRTTSDLPRVPWPCLDA